LSFDRFAFLLIHSAREQLAEGKEKKRSSKIPRERSLDECYLDFRSLAKVPAMSLSVSLRPLPTLNACQSVPIQWTYAGSAEGQLKLVFVSAQQQQSVSKLLCKAS
jgi:hypothetical protein